VLIVVGVVFLLQNLGYVTGEVWNIVWPAFIILLGISILLKKDKKIIVSAEKNEEDKDNK
jgi:uncharacterized membrane protein